MAVLRAPNSPILMPDIWLTQGFALVVGVTFVAGLVYGFAGFGAALIYMPVATSVLHPPVAIGAFAVCALASFVTLVPRAWVQSDKRGSMIMLAAAIVGTPIGLWILSNTDTTLLRWVLSGIVVGTLAVLMTAWRYQMQPSGGLRAGIGGLAGVMMGSVGLNGPLVILFQLGGQDTIVRSRANTLVFLTCSSLSLVPLMALQGLIGWDAILLGAVLLVPYGAGTVFGRRLFDPARETLYRRVAYAIVALAAVLGLPLWQG